MNNKEILVEEKNGVITVIFNRPETNNAMTKNMRKFLGENLLIWNKDPSVRTLVMRGTGGNFIAGGDLNAFAETAQLSAEERDADFVMRVSESTSFITTLTNFTKPVISVIDGDVAGAGIGIALASDFIIGTTKARFTFAHAHVGLALDIGLSYFLPRLVGPLQAKRLAMLGGQVKSEEALSLGLITFLADHADEALTKLLTQIEKMSLPAISGIKAEINASSTNTLFEQLGFEAQTVGQSARSEEFKSRVERLVRKRPS